MGTEVSARTECTDFGECETGLYRGNPKYLEVERKRIGEELQEISKKRTRLRQYRRALDLCPPDEVPDIVERINAKMDETEQRRNALYKATKYYDQAIQCVTFLESDWCQFLLMGNKLTPIDIIKEWNETAQALYGITDEHHPVKITEEQIKKMFVLRKRGMTYKQIAQALGISEFSVRKYINERS